MEKTEVNEDDGLKRMVQMSTIFQSPGFQNEKKKRTADVLTAPKKKQQKTEETSKSIQHMTKIGPYDPKVYAMVEEIRAETEETEKAIQSMTPAEEGEIVEAELELSSNEIKYQRAGRGKIYFEPSHIQYLPVRNQVIDIIEVQIAETIGEGEDLVKFKAGHSIVTLHFKKG